MGTIGEWVRATGALVGGDTWVLLGEWGRATGALVGGDTWVLTTTLGMGLQGH